MRRLCVLLLLIGAQVLVLDLHEARAATLTCGGSQADFNGDGRIDLAVAGTGEDIGSVRNAGAVNVIYGAAGGLSATGDDFWHQDVSGIAGVSEGTENFGWALAAGDFDSDGFADLAVGVPGESVGSVEAAGAVNIIYGSSSGLTATGDQAFDQNSSGIAGAAEPGDNFGTSLAACDFDGDGFDDLAIGVPSEDVGSLEEAGAVNIIYGSSSGLTATGDQIFEQDVSGIADSAEAFEVFGFILGSGDFDGDDRADLAVGVPLEDVGGDDDAGGVNVLYGSSAGLTATGDQFFTQDVSGIIDSAEPFDQFGWSIAVGDFDADDRSDLAVGAAQEDVGSVDKGGAVNVIYGTSSGLTATDDEFWSQDAAGIVDTAEAEDRFGWKLAAGDIDGNGADDLAIGIPREDIGTIQSAGAVNVLYGGAGGGLSSTNDDFWHQDSPGINGSAEASKFFGDAIAVGDFDNDNDGELAIGIPLEDVSGVNSAGAVSVLDSTADGLVGTGDEVWHQDVAGIADSAEELELWGISLVGSPNIL